MSCCPQVENMRFSAVALALWREERLWIFTKGLTARLVSSITFSFFIILGYETVKRWSLKDEYKHMVRWWHSIRAALEDSIHDTASRKLYIYHSIIILYTWKVLYSRFWSVKGKSKYLDILLLNHHIYYCHHIYYWNHTIRVRVRKTGCGKVILSFIKAHTKNLGFAMLNKSVHVSMHHKMLLDS